jgi:hypothetical protein
VLGSANDVVSNVENNKMNKQPKCPFCGEDSTYWKFNWDAPEEREAELICCNCGARYFHHNGVYRLIKIGTILGVTMIITSLIMMF